MFIGQVWSGKTALHIQIFFYGNWCAWLTQQGYPLKRRLYLTGISNVCSTNFWDTLVCPRRTSSSHFEINVLFKYVNKFHSSSQSRDDNRCERTYHLCGTHFLKSEVELSICEMLKILNYSRHWITRRLTQFSPTQNMSSPHAKSTPARHRISSAAVLCYFALWQEHGVVYN